MARYQLDGTAGMSSGVRMTGGRLLFAMGVVVFLSLILFARLYYLQVHSYSTYESRSADNRVQVVPLPPVRGLIFDRNGALLASNLPVHQLEIIPYRTADVKELVNNIAEVIPIEQSEIDDFWQTRKVYSRFSGQALKTRLTDQEVAMLAVERHRLPGSRVRAELQRFYPQNEIGAHVLGRVGRIDSDDEQRLDPARYRGLQYIGKSGIELMLEDYLVGEPGVSQVETNAHGRRIRQLSSVSPKSGQNVYLTLDFGLQKVAYDALEEFSGAAVALEPQTGKVLAMVSKPSYDPNFLSSGLKKAKYQEYLASKDDPLVNRAIQGLYAPGSTLKIFLALAAYEIKKNPPSVFCPGYFTIPGKKRKYRCWRDEYGHGLMNIKQAIAQSCDVYFYTLAHEMGISEIYYRLSRFGFGSLTEVGMQPEKKGILPSPEWKEWTLGEKWYTGETISVGIGQGYLLVTMMQLANAVSVIANQGDKFKPQIVERVLDVNTGEVTEFEPELVGRVDVDDSRYYEKVIDAMVEVVHGKRGTARRIGRELSNFRAAGKTGTVQVLSKTQADLKEENIEITRDMLPHGIFVSFAPVDDPQIVVAVIAEHSESGSKQAASVARDMMNYYIAGQQPTRTPENIQVTLN